MNSKAKNIKKIPLSEEAIEFLFYSYFGIGYESLIGDKEKEENAKFICFKRAYRDFNRTLSFNESKKEDDDFPAYVWENGLKDKINEILEIHNQDNQDGQTQFDTLHKNICEIIKEIAENCTYVEGFSYGQAQKWLNMTLKYMCLIGIWEDKFNELKHYLHVPLDNYIFKAMDEKKGLKKGEDLSGWVSCIKMESGGQYKVWYKMNTEEDTFCCLIEKKDRINRKQREEKTVWSQINSYDLYLEIQKKLRENISNDFKCVYDWEFNVWLQEAAQSV